MRRRLLLTASFVASLAAASVAHAQTPPPAPVPVEPAAGASLVQPFTLRWARSSIPTGRSEATRGRWARARRSRRSSRPASPRNSPRHSGADPGHGEWSAAGDVLLAGQGVADGRRRARLDRFCLFDGAQLQRDRRSAPCRAFRPSRPPPPAPASTRPSPSTSTGPRCPTRSTTCSKPTTSRLSRIRWTSTTDLMQFGTTSMPAGATSSPTSTTASARFRPQGPRAASATLNVKITNTRRSPAGTDIALADRRRGALVPDQVRLDRHAESAARWLRPRHRRRAEIRGDVRCVPGPERQPLGLHDGRRPAAGHLLLAGARRARPGSRPLVGRRRVSPSSPVRRSRRASACCRSSPPRHPSRAATPTQARVTLTQPAPAGGVTVQVASDMADVETPASVFIPAGATDAMVARSRHRRFALPRSAPSAPPTARAGSRARSRCSRSCGDIRSAQRP